MSIPRDLYEGETSIKRLQRRVEMLRRNAKAHKIEDMEGRTVTSHYEIDTFVFDAILDELKNTERLLVMLRRETGAGK